MRPERPREAAASEQRAVGTTPSPFAPTTQRTLNTPTGGGGEGAPQPQCPLSKEPGICRARKRLHFQLDEDNADS